MIERANWKSQCQLQKEVQHLQWTGNLTIKWEFLPWTHEIPPLLGTTVVEPFFMEKYMNLALLTLWEPGYGTFVLWNRPENSSYQLPYQHPSSSANCARELFKGSNESASLLICTRKKIFGWVLQIFCEWRHKWSCFWAILAHVAWPRPQSLGQSISLKFSLQTRLKFESFEPLIDFLAFLVQKLWS